MAEIVLEFVIKTLTSSTIKEIKSLKSVRKQVERIQRDLEIIRPVLKNADARAATEDMDQQDRNEGVRKWVEQVREVAYRIEDVLDKSTVLEAELHQGTGLCGLFSKICHLMKKLKRLHNIAADIQDINLSLGQKLEQIILYDLISSTLSNRMQSDTLGGRGISQEDQIVVNESVREELVGWLVAERAQHRVFALVGAGGLGKTTLAANVYEHPAARIFFDCYAWIEVEREYNREDVLRKLLGQLYRSRKEEHPVNIDGMGLRGLTDLLRVYLKDKRYMIVFDGVWQAAFWNNVEHALLDNNKGSRIIITTRDRGVADYILTSTESVYIRVLEDLPADKAWQLFCRKAFSDGVCPQHLERFSHDILKKCEGLPLAIVTLAGLLSEKNEDNQWQMLLNNLDFKLERDIYLSDCNRVLCESFNDLPNRLKLCLLYFAMFSASYLVECEKLTYLWIAEGFVQLQDNMNSTLEEVAEEYLNELISRNLVKVSKTSIEGKATLVRVHNLMHVIILRMAKQFGFSQVFKMQDPNQQIKTRRITVQKGTKNIVKSIHKSKVRSVFSFDIDELPYPFMSTLFDANIKLMKVLDFKDVALEYKLPRQVGNIFNLRYLILSNTKVKAIPKSIGKLFNLQILDLKHTLVSELPSDIKYLKKLRHLLVCHLDSCHLDQFNFTFRTRTKIQEGIGCLTDLQKLNFVEANSEVVQELSKLRQLRELGVRVTNAKGNDLCASISKMKHLKSLNLESIDSGEIIDLHPMASPPQYLELLYLAGNLTKLPNWISNHQKLVKIRLAWSGLTDDPMRILHTLPNLMKLSLVAAYNGEALHFGEGWFPKLLKLRLFDLKGLKLIIVHNDALPLLLSLQIGSCPLLEFPTGIVNLRKLNELILVDMSIKFLSNVGMFSHFFKIFVILKEEGKHITEKVYRPPDLDCVNQLRSSLPSKPRVVHPAVELPMLVAAMQEKLKPLEQETLLDKKKEAYNPPLSPGIQQISKDGKKGEDIIEKVYGPGDLDYKIPSHSPNILKSKTVQEKEGEEIQSHQHLQDAKLPNITEKNDKDEKYFEKQIPPKGKT